MEQHVKWLEDKIAEYRKLAEKSDKQELKESMYNPNTMYHYYTGKINAYKEAWEQITGKDYDGSKEADGLHKGAVMQK